MKLRLTLFFLIFYCCVFAQDTLVLCEKKDPSKEYKIALGQYLVKVMAIDNEIFDAFIVGYEDSSLILKSRNYDQTVRRQVKQMYDDALNLADSLKLKAKEADSLILLVRNKETKIIYSVDTSIAISHIKKIKIDNRFVPEKKKQTKNLERNSYIALIGTPIVLAASIIFLPPATLPYIIVPVFSAGVTFAVIKLVLQIKRLNFRKKWTVKKLIKS